jgi:hypothetical protein
MLEEPYRAAQTEPSANEHVRTLTARSLKKLINQLEQEIARNECYATPPEENAHHAT